MNTASKVQMIYIVFYSE